MKLVLQFSGDTHHLLIPKHVDLIDPTFAFDMILMGTTHFFRVFRYGLISLGNDLPLLRNIAFRRVISGHLRNCRFSSPYAIGKLVHRF